MRPAYLIAHHSLTKDSGTVSWPAIRRYHVDELGWSDIGYQFGIEDINGHQEILVGRMMNKSGAHCKQKGMNRKSIGILFTGNFDLAPPPPEMWKLGLRLARTLMEIFYIPKDHVFGHREFASYKTCPGSQFDMDLFRAQL